MSPLEERLLNQAFRPPLSVLVSQSSPTGQRILTYLEEKQIPYFFIPTRGAAPQITYRHRAVYGFLAIMDFLNRYRAEMTGDQQ